MVVRLHLGHPIGASGARILVSLIHEMKKTNARHGLATLCIGGGQGVATIVENVELNRDKEHNKKRDFQNRSLVFLL